MSNSDQFRYRVLVVGGKYAGQQSLVEALRHVCDVDICENPHDAMESLRQQDYQCVMTDAGDFLPLERGLVGQQSSLVLNTIGEGVCIVDADGVCRWSNNRLRRFTPEVIEKVKQICRQALTIFAKQTSYDAQLNGKGDAPKSRSKKFSFNVDDDRYFEMMTSPVVSERNEVTQVVAVVWDATSGRRLQQKLDAIDNAGRELSRLESEAVAGLTPGDRLKLLQDKIIGFSKDLMHFDHFAIRLLDKRTNRLEVVIAEGLPPEAIDIDLYATPDGNGISGYVAATGRSYICHDTEKDPRYVIGLEHCMSSLTVPLMLHDRVIGVFNIESCQVGTFNEDDRQFAEIFGRYVALALNILDLLVVERYTTTGLMADNVVSELSAPLNDIVTEAQSLMEDYIGDDAMRNRLSKIVTDVQSIRDTVRDVAAGPKAVLGTHETRVDDHDPIISDRRILIADDEPNIRRTLGEILTKLGGQCTICKDGYEAVSHLEQSQFDMVLSDIKMPYRNGYEIFAVAKRHDATIPVLLMTGFGYDPNHSIVRAGQEGLSGVLFKPFKVDQMLTEVRKALTTGATLRAEKSATEPTAVRSQTEDAG